MFDASKDLITQIEECYGRIATDIHWDDNSEPYTYLCGRMKVGSNQRKARLRKADVFVMFFRIYSDGDYQTIEGFQEELKFELDNIKKFLDENSRY